MKTTHTHKGVCQVCGLVHAVDNKSNLLAKHGYDVQWGFFRGVCMGADNLPLQLDRTLVDSTIAMLRHDVKKNLRRLEDLPNWKPAKVFGFLDAEGKRTRYNYNYFYDYDALSNDLERESRSAIWYAEKGNTTVAYTWDEFEKICSESFEPKYNYYYHDASKFLEDFRNTKKRALIRNNQEMESHIGFLQEQIERYHGEPLFESAMIMKVVKELTDEAAQEILNEQPVIETKTSWDGREYQRRVYSIWDSEATKEVNGHTLTIKCSRNTKNYNGYLAYTYLDGKKVAKKKLEEVLG